MQQLLRERAAKDKVESADYNPEAKPRRAREKLSEDPNPSPEVVEQAPSAVNHDDDPEDDELIRKAKAAMRAKKEKKTEAQIQREEHRLLRQYHPETEVDG